MMKTNQILSTVAMGALSIVALTLASCTRDKRIDNDPKQVVVNFLTGSLSDSSTRSAGTVAENEIASVALFGLDGSGVVVCSFPLIDNPRSGTTLTLPATVSSLRAIANPTAAQTLDYTRASELDAERIDFTEAPAAPFTMGGIAPVNGNGVVDIELVRSIARIDVTGNDGFEVTSVTVVNTPATGYIFAQPVIPVFSQADYTAYPEVDGGTVYVGENGSEMPTRIRVHGVFNGAPTAYTFTLQQNGRPVDIVRNTAYVVRVTPYTDTDFGIEVSIPDWDDVAVDDNFVVDFGNYYSVDFHNHTAFTDGSNSLEWVFRHGMRYGLDILVNSEHGGTSGRNATIGGNTANRPPTWYDSGVYGDMLLGDDNGRGDNMWRWQVIRDYSWPFIARFNESNSGDMLVVQGLEWNVPGHEHGSSGVITGQFDGGDNAVAMAQFEYMFDNSDGDRSGGEIVKGESIGWGKSPYSGHEKSLDAARWMQANHRYTSWIVPAHPERQNRWLINHYRDMNNAAPDVFVAFESIPGHQGEGNRGSYGTSAYEGQRTRGGVGVQTAELGNVWDALLSEGRRFWVVANSDFHSYGGDFYPGEYQKTYISMKERTAQGFVDGLRSGNVFAVMGDLIDRLEFSVGYATMGQTYTTAPGTARVRILVNDPEGANHNAFTALTHPALDHIDLIAGEMRSRVAPGTAEYENGTWDKVRVIARFDAQGGVTDGNGLTSVRWEDLGGGLKLVEYTVEVTGDTYFRLRGTNHGLNVAGETDANGNPLPDEAGNNQSKAFDDLWFYSNPVFVRTR